MLCTLVSILIALSLLFPKTRSISLSAIGIAMVAIVTVSRHGEAPTLRAAAPRGGTKTDGLRAISCGEIGCGGAGGKELAYPSAIFGSIRSVPMPARIAQGAALMSASGPTPFGRTVGPDMSSGVAVLVHASYERD